MRLLNLGKAILVLTGLSLGAHADTITYSFENTQNQLAGTVVITDGLVTFGNFSMNTENFGVYIVSSAPFQPENGGGIPNDPYHGTAYFSATNGATFFLAYLKPTTALGNLRLCSGYHECIAANDGSYYSELYSSKRFLEEVVDGDLTPIAQTTSAATPEPSSLILLSTGILGAVGVARRRFLSR